MAKQFFFGLVVEGDFCFCFLFKYVVIFPIFLHNAVRNMLFIQGFEGLLVGVSVCDCGVFGADRKSF